MHNYFNYIFDLDGTLINSSDEVLSCFEKAFKKANVQFDKSRLTSNIIGPPLKEILTSINPNISDENVINNIILNYRNFYDYDENDISVMYDGVFEFLRKLKNSDKKIFLATLKPEIPTIRVLKKFGLDIFFDDVYTIDKYGKNISKSEMVTDIIRKYNLEKSKTCMIGDTLSDVIAAKSAKITAIGALWGYGDDKTGLIQNSDYTINSIEELWQK